MKILAALCFLFTISGSLIAQEQELIVRYDFSDKSSPPMKPFYLRVYIDSVLVDSTKSHAPNHNLANAVRAKVAKGYHYVKIEGMVIEKNAAVPVLTKVMEWETSIEAGKMKARIILKLNGKYQIESSTKTE
jgi:hypothetical protein